MYQVKEFKDEQNKKADNLCNEWLKKMGENIEIIEFKYKMVVKPETRFSPPVCISSILAIYKTKN